MLLLESNQRTSLSRWPSGREQLDAARLDLLVNLHMIYREQILCNRNGPFYWIVTNLTVQWSAALARSSNMRDLLKAHVRNYSQRLAIRRRFVFFVSLTGEWLDGTLEQVIHWRHFWFDIHNYVVISDSMRHRLARNLQTLLTDSGSNGGEMSCWCQYWHAGEMCRFEQVQLWLPLHNGYTSAQFGLWNLVPKRVLRHLQWGCGQFSRAQVFPWMRRELHKREGKLKALNVATGRFNPTFLQF